MASAPVAEQVACPCALFRQMPVAFLLVNRDLRVIEGNELFWGDLCDRAPAPIGTSLAEALPPDLLKGIGPAVERAFETREAAEVEGLLVHIPGHPHRIVDLDIVPGTTHGCDAVLVATSAASAAGQRIAELSLLHNMVRVLRRETEVDRVLFTVLTCATAGSGGMGFNRAWVLLVDPTGQRLEGRMALGPASTEEAHRIWSEIASQPPRTLEELAKAYDRHRAKGVDPLNQLARTLRFSMADDAAQLPVLVGVARKAVKVDDAYTNERVPARLREVLGVREFVAAPMIASGQPCGVIIADNLYSGAPITQAHTRLLSLFAQHAGMAIEHARLDQHVEAQRNELLQAYASLKETHRELVRAKQLAALGEMSARVAHDLRNPLVTLAGWARVLEEEPGDAEAVERAAGIIADQAEGLLGILSMLLEPLGARTIRLEPTDLNRLLQDVAEAQRPDLDEHHIELVMDLAPDLGTVALDPGQFRRCLINLIDNAVRAMPNGGALTLSSRRGEDDVTLQVADTGIGMTQETTSKIFDAFFTTRHYGSGLGLAVVWDIVQAHGGTVEVASAPGQGATFMLHTPTTHRPSGDMPPGGQIEGDG